MARYDVHPDPAGFGYLLDVQADLLDDLNTRTVVPLMRPQDAPLPAHRLNPAFEIDGARYLMVTQYISAIPANRLERPLTNLSDQFHEITNALDMLFHGF